MFTAIYPQIHALYPDTTFQPLEATVDEQSKMLINGRLDISFQTIYERKYKNLVYHTILYEPFYLCVPKSHPLAYDDDREPENYPEISLIPFRDDLFTLVKKSSTMRSIIDNLFLIAGFKPKLLFESTSMQTMQQLAGNGQCCTIIPRYYAVPSKDIAYFSLGADASWELAAVHAQHHYINAAAKDFIHLAAAYWRQNLHSWQNATQMPSPETPSR